MTGMVKISEILTPEEIKHVKDVWVLYHSGPERTKVYDETWEEREKLRKGEL